MKVGTYWLSLCLFVIFFLVGYIISLDLAISLLFGSGMSVVLYGLIMGALGIKRTKRKRRIYGNESIRT